MRAVPEVGVTKPASIRMVVDFPAPFGPRKPSTSPLLTVNETWSTAVKPPNRFVKPSISMNAAPSLVATGLSLLTELRCGTWDIPNSTVNASRRAGCCRVLTGHAANPNPLPRLVTFAALPYEWRLRRGRRRVRSLVRPALPAAGNCAYSLSWKIGAPNSLNRNSWKACCPSKSSTRRSSVSCRSCSTTTKCLP